MLAMEAAGPAMTSLLSAVNALAFLLFAVDKIQAQGGRTRVPETTLHLATLGLGAAGACWGRWLFRHKTLKGSFTVTGVFGLLVMFAFAQAVA